MVIYIYMCVLYFQKRLLIVPKYSENIYMDGDVQSLDILNIPLVPTNIFGHLEAGRSQAAGMPMYVFMVIKISHTMSHLTHTHPQTADRIDEHFPAMMLEKKCKTQFLEVLD